MENNHRPLESFDEIIGIMTRLVDLGYRRTDLIVEIRHLLNAREFISPTVIRSHNFNQWLRNVLDIASVNNLFEEHTQHKGKYVRIIRSIEPEYFAELSNAF